jgi:hypothetical protein
VTHESQVAGRPGAMAPAPPTRGWRQNLPRVDRGRPTRESQRHMSPKPPHARSQGTRARRPVGAVTTNPRFVSFGPPPFAPAALTCARRYQPAAASSAAPSPTEGTDESNSAHRHPYRRRRRPRPQRSHQERRLSRHRDGLRGLRHPARLGRPDPHEAGSGPGHGLHHSARSDQHPLHRPDRRHLAAHLADQRPQDEGRQDPGAHRAGTPQAARGQGRRLQLHAGRSREHREARAWTTSSRSAATTP